MPFLSKPALSCLLVLATASAHQEDAISCESEAFAFSLVQLRSAAIMSPQADEFHIRPDLNTDEIVEMGPRGKTSFERMVEVESRRQHDCSPGCHNENQHAAIPWVGEPHKQARCKWTSCQLCKECEASKYAPSVLAADTKREESEGETDESEGEVYEARSDQAYADISDDIIDQLDSLQVEGDGDQCIKIETGSNEEDAGVLEVHIDHGSGVRPPANTTSYGTDAPVIKCYTRIDRVIVSNPTNNSWTGGILISTDGGKTFSPLKCTGCSKGSSSDKMVVVGNLEIPSKDGTHCDNGLSCMLLKDQDCAESTCAIADDPHVRVFDGKQISLLQADQKASMVNMMKGTEVADVWLVRGTTFNGLSVDIQAKYMTNITQIKDAGEHAVFVRSLAVGGYFIQGNKLVIGPLVEHISWNGKPILLEEDSEFYLKGLIHARRHFNSTLVEDMSIANPGINIQFPHGVKMTINRRAQYVNVAIRMPKLTGGQDGLCGNFNGDASDDSLEMIESRNIEVQDSDSLFKRPSTDFR